MEKSFAIVGGDGRQTALAQLLREDGCKVVTHAVPGCESCTLERAAQAERILLPLPLSRETGLLNCAEEQVELKTFFNLLSPEQFICGGQISAQVRVIAAPLMLEDYFLREELTVANAIPTAEGALQAAMERLPITLCGARCLVLGYGRIGKLLMHRLLGLGAQVTVAARKYADLAWIAAFGAQALQTAELQGHLADVQVVFNTVPALLLDRVLLSELAQDCLCVDVASQPGIDFAAAEELSIPAIWARFLPGKVAPQTAAAAIRDSIYHIIIERGEPI